MQINYESLFDIKEIDYVIARDNQKEIELLERKIVEQNLQLSNLIEKIKNLDINDAKQESIQSLPTAEYAHRNLVNQINSDWLQQGIANSLES